MNDDDIAAGGGAQSGTTKTRPPMLKGPDDDVGAGTSTATVMRTTNRAAEAPSKFETQEVIGDAPITPSDKVESTAPNNTEVSPDGESGAGESAEASQEQLGAESGEESAVSDLRGIEGFEESASTGTESATETGLAEVGAVMTGETAEFLPFLAALVPTLVSTVGPMIAKGIAGGLSPRAKKVIAKLPAPGAAAPGVKPGSLGSLLAQIAQLLNTLKARPGSETAPEASEEAVVTEAIAVLESIIGVDDRVRIQNTQGDPWRRICALRITFPTGATYRGSGFLIGPRAVATAGHCVYLHNQGGWARKVEVMPGMNGSMKPYGSVESSQLRSVSGWVNNKKPESDYGCVVLPQGAFGGKSLGSFGRECDDRPGARRQAGRSGGLSRRQALCRAVGHGSEDQDGRACDSRL